MLKKYSFILLYTLTSFYTLAQDDKAKDKFSIKKSFYSKISAGYSFRTGNGSKIQHSDLSNGSFNVSRTPMSYGKGFNINYGIGCFFNKNIGADLSLSYFIGSNNESNHFYLVGDNISYYNVNETISDKANLFRINPSFVICSEFNRVIPYAKFGILFGWGNGSSEIEDNVSYSNGAKARGTFNWELEGGRTFGYTSNVGIKIKSEDDVFDYFVEFSYIAMSGTFKKAAKTTHSINGNSSLNTLSTYDKEVIFVDEINSSDNSSNKPQKQLKTKLPFDGIGFNIGVIINFNRHF